MTPTVTASGRVHVLIASYIEPDLVERIRRVDPRVDVTYEPRFLGKPRYACDHHGFPFTRSVQDEAEWRALLRKADILFDFDYTNDADLPELAPNVKWIQASSAGIGQFVVRRRYHERMKRTIFTTASGVHTQALAEFCSLAILAFSRDLLTMQEQQRAAKWERFAPSDLLGRTLLIYGYGAIGREVGRMARALGLRVVGVKRNVTEKGREEAKRDDVTVVSASSFRAELPNADYLVLSAPHTKDTERVLSGAEIALLKSDAVVINIGRGALIDEEALIEALRDGRLKGAALDVFEKEPLPSTSPLWSLRNVIVSPHSASNTDRENARLVDLFCSNLRRFLAGEPLENVLDVERLY